MLVPLRWLRDLVDVPVDAATLAHDLTMSGTKIEAVHGGAPAFEGVFVGRVLERQPHPGADRLSLCRVEVGGEELRIVCGAANVRAGLTVAVAKVGARLPGGSKIRKSKIRGETSEGMICSARELGLGEDAAGILELEPGLVSGTDFATVSSGDDIVLEAEVTPNRPDCLGMIGIAREVAAIYGGALRLPPVWSGPSERGELQVPVEIEDPADCARYLGRSLAGVQRGPSPDWMQARLRAVGLAPIDNVVDITNYVLYECGQPLHAFDRARLRGPRIVVRRARAGERLRTLDGVDRGLDAAILVIADDAGPVALAGIMGGADSAVGDTTHELLLEAAWFDPAVVRRGRRQLGLDTDASYRFERRADVEAARWAADRATALLIELAGARVAGPDGDVWPGRAAPRVVALRVERCNRLVGTDLAAGDIAALLARLALPAVVRDDRVEVEVPSFRRDLHSEVDLVEEVARVHGYDRIPAETVPPAPVVQRDNPRAALLERLRRQCVALGYFEARTSAFMDRRDPDRLGLPDDDRRRQLVRVANPIVSHLDTMRTTLLPGMLRVLGHNRRHDQEPLRFAQVDRVFWNLPGPNPGLPTETEMLVLVGSGPAEPASWARPARTYDLYDLKGDAEALLADLGVDTSWVYGYTETFLNEGLSFVFSGTCGVMGRGGAVREGVLRQFDLEPPVFALGVDVGALEAHLPGVRRYRELPRFPAVKRDLSLVVPPGVSYADVEAVARGAAGPQLESLQCFDVFAAGPAGGERSVGLRLRYRDAERTLADDDVAPSIAAIVRRLADSLRVTLRAG